MQEHSIILFDGVCNLCNYWVNFTVDRDKNDLYRFATLQSEEGQLLLQQYNIKSTDIESIVLIKGENVYTKSTAALLISKTLSGPIRITYPVILLPRMFRDFIYDLIAKNRYKIFGKRNVCRLPIAAERYKFL